jgi:hypothetical protein
MIFHACIDRHDPPRDWRTDSGVHAASTIKLKKQYFPQE